MAVPSSCSPRSLLSTAMASETGRSIPNPRIAARIIGGVRFMVVGYSNSFYVYLAGSPYSSSTHGFFSFPWAFLSEKLELFMFVNMHTCLQTTYVHCSAGLFRLLRTVWAHCLWWGAINCNCRYSFLLVCTEGTHTKEALSCGCLMHSCIQSNIRFVRCKEDELSTEILA